MASVGSGTTSTTCDVTCIPWPQGKRSVPAAMWHFLPAKKRHIRLALGSDSPCDTQLVLDKLGVTRGWSRGMVEGDGRGGWSRGMVEGEA